ncbi:Asp-tRNA(Asn)/Glu-tRNA(Gln) amidotransferase subunit GatA [Leptospira borgpetersenii]|uniref:Asp-tRNA(Asn)/Glu-tRNA(Gln) amidotransferase subunit GatA n=1 Tax=Leptospira borgpetersenii TaxID=174 RepID=UPI00187F5956|nr:Asp-tRNA(Asn)/Glu-tRNA(Gln) amidotransferase subunit GatA [Leptospira borgpetersenii]MBE8363706.1 Asp-tRNA(Asn)/Glu-tRNA(Gln) amidotransferase subunit GatA [Leptospira borgpetersenii serovar Balcanica]MBE8366294.1 Asp-tRNA(Asn)/Glu-tRNA(Gln) amidotransferase subunit GatA [Leptospira borgpetersenii serovar Balcanica]MBE8422755.1 Asp-tRNA(Asn)/Glu-tRNA(Gln) amidotransferase subunit GatA [Leptospira borgpetersenii serovar Balcanica]MBF3349865.1 Asp-tRNA(Asn)/Glu-tRNA(Gln) amidotransferase subun
MNEILRKSYAELKSSLSLGKISATELATACIERIKEVDGSVKAFLSLDEKRILDAASESDARRKSGNPLSEFDGMPIAIKDNICIRDSITSCASKILENYKSPFHATVIEKLIAKGFVLIPRANMDEFAMGSSTENSAFQTTRNPFDLERIPGGSSGGSAAAVAASMVPLALGSDTGGSVRQPASLCGLYGLKPTYGTVSRYGLVAYASSLDQIGPFSKELQGCIDLYSVISGKDERDSTSLNHPGFSAPWTPDFKGLKIGTIKMTSEIQPEVVKAYEKVLNQLKEKGATLVELDFSKFDFAIPIYYIIATAECSSNLSRFDGIRFGSRKDKTGKLEDLFVDSRTTGFGSEVKRRILLGTFSLSAGYYGAYYGTAQKARVLIRKEYDSFFSKVDFILQPTSPTTAFKVGEKTKDPIQMYKADIWTTSVNLAGIPAISVPMGTDEKGLPIGLQITAPHFQEGKLFGAAQAIGALEDLNIKFPENIG